MRGVAATRREVHEERLLCVLSPHAVHPADGSIGHGVGEVVRVLLVVVLRRGADDVLVLGEARVPLARPAPEDAVEVIEAPPGRPPVERPRRTLLAVRGQVPLAERTRAVAVVSEDPRQRRAVAGQDRRVARKSSGELTDRPETNRVVVAARQERRPGRGTQCGHVEAVVAQAALRHAGVVRGLDRPSEGAGVAEAGIVDQHQQDVGCAGGWRRLGDEAPVGLGTVERLADRAPERLTADRESRAVWLAHRTPPGPRRARRPFGPGLPTPDGSRSGAPGGRSANRRERW